MNNDIELLKDVIQIAKHLAWQNQQGDAMAQERIDEIHRGKYDGHCEGVWVQADNAINRLEAALQLATDHIPSG